MNWQFMDNDLKKSIVDLIVEIKKDIYFFGFCGAIVGTILICSVIIEYIEIYRNIDFAPSLFKEFISAKILIFFLIVYFLIGTLNILSRRKFILLDKAAIQARKRFYQAGSSIISFVIGFAPFILFFWCITNDSAAKKLLIVLLFFIPFIAISVSTVDLVTQREKICDRTLGFSITLLLLVYYAIHYFSS